MAHALPPSPDVPLSPAGWLPQGFVLVIDCSPTQQAPFFEYYWVQRELSKARVSSSKSLSATSSFSTHSRLEGFYCGDTIAAYLPRHRAESSCMKPSFEKIPTEATASWTLLNRRLPEAIPFKWHHHPEYELTLTLNSRGHRYIGNDVTSYDDGDLILVGPNVPHSWSSAERVDAGQPHVALVIWFSAAWAESLVTLFAELGSLRQLLAVARQAVSFSAAVSREVRPLIETMV